MALSYADIVEQPGAPILASGTLGCVGTLVGDGKRVVTASAAALAVGDARATATPVRAGVGSALAFGAILASPSLKTRCHGFAEARATVTAEPSLLKEIAASRTVARATVVLRNYDSATFTGAGARIDLVSGTAVERLPVELRLCRSFPYPALEECRRRTLQAVNVSSDITVQARTVLGFAYSTELKSVFVQLLDAAESSLGTVSGKARTAAIDRELQVLTMRYPQVFRELQDLRMPDAYQSLLEARLTSTSFNHRVSAMCAMLTLVAALLLDDEAQA